MSEPKNVKDLHKMLSALDSVDVEEIYTELMGILVSFINAKTVSIYNFGNDKEYLRLKVRIGDSGKLPNSIEIENTGWIKVVIKDKGVYQSSALGSEPLLIAPIIHEKEVLGFIGVEDMEFTMPTQYTFDLFKVIVESSSKALVNALNVENLLKGEKYYGESSIMRPEYFEMRLEHERRRQETYGLIYSLLEYDHSATSIKELDEKLKGVVRNVDVISYDQDKEKLLFLLPVCKEEYLPAIDKRIKGRLG